MVAIGCETEPVSKNEEFQAFAKRALDAVDAEGAEAVEQLEKERQELVGEARREHRRRRRAARFEAVEGGVIDGYVHPPANKLGVLVRCAAATPELARKLAMHIAGSPPQWIGREEVPEDAVDGRARDLRELGRGASRSRSRRVRRSSRAC